MRSKATLLVTVADNQIFTHNIIDSVMAEESNSRCEIIAIVGAPSQSKGINSHLGAAKNDLIVCPHQDVFFKPGWLDRLLELVRTCPEPWGVLGPAGTTDRGKMCGTHSGLGMDGYQHVEAQTLDGSCLIFRKSSGLRFDENLDRFHGYDVDLCLEARSRGFKNYVIDLPIEHRTRWASTAGQGAQDFQNAMRYCAEKWHPRGVGPIYTTFGTY